MVVLRNARKMAVIRQDRRLAAEVLRACSLYVRDTLFPCDHEIFDRLADSIADKNNASLLEAFAKVEKELSVAVKGSDKREWRTIKLPR
jgi:hypothetical protein